MTSLKILDGEIADADVSPTAAILGTKISPDFGGQDVATTGTLEAGNTTITGTLSTTDTATIGANTITDVDGTSGQVLTTNGAGNASWQSPLTSIVIGMGQVDIDALAESTSGLITGVDRNNIGDYTVNLDPGFTGNYIVQLTAINTTSTSIIQLATQGATTFNVNIFDEDGTALDSAWQFMVIQFTP